MNDFSLKKINTKNIEKELSNIGFDKSYLGVAKDKYEQMLLKFFGLTPVQATILKETALSVGTDVATARGVLTHSIEQSDCILAATTTQAKKITAKLRLQPFGMKKLADLIEQELELSLEPLEIRGKIFDWEREKYLMGILNVTPDSFSDGNKCFLEEAAVKHTVAMIEMGADIIDIGAESTRPYSKAITIDEEQKRLLPILTHLRKEFPDVIFSVDTRNAQTAQKAYDLGADIINDVSFGNYDEKMFEVVTKLNVPYVLMHSIATPETMQDNIHYNNLIDDIYCALAKKIKYLTEQGLNRKNIIVDLGIGFGKNKSDNYELINSLPDFKSLKCPLLIGHSRKSFLKDVCDLAPVELDDIGAMLSALLFDKGANILRVHNISKNMPAKFLWKHL